MSSRYMMDFAPAFAVAMWVLLQFAGYLVRWYFQSGHNFVAAAM